MLTLRNKKADRQADDRAPAHAPIHGEDRMGLILLAVALLAFGVYAAFFFASLLPIDG